MHNSELTRQPRLARTEIRRCKRSKGLHIYTYVYIYSGRGRERERETLTLAITFKVALSTVHAGDFPATILPSLYILGTLTDWPCL